MSRSYDHGGNILAIARSMGVPAGEIIDFSASINPLGMPASIRTAVTASLDSLVHYPDSSQAGLKQKLAERHGLLPDNIVVANGSTEIIYQLPALTTHRRAAVISPSFSEYLHALRQWEYDVQHILLSPRNNFALDLQQISGALAQGCGLLYLCNPGNPSGTLYPRQIIRDVEALCRETGTLLVLDEAFMDFCGDNSAADVVVNGANGVVLRSMTKFFAIPGLRLGYALAAPEIIDRLTGRCGPWSVNTLAQAAGIAALEDHQFAAETVRCIDRERSYLFQGLEQINGLRPTSSAANYLLVELTGQITAPELTAGLLKMKLLVRDCSNFIGLSGQFIRVAVRTRRENDLLLEGLNKLLGTATID